MTCMKTITIMNSMSNTERREWVVMNLLRVRTVFVYHIEERTYYVVECGGEFTTVWFD